MNAARGNAGRRATRAIDIKNSNVRLTLYRTKRIKRASLEVIRGSRSHPPVPSIRRADVLSKEVTMRRTAIGHFLRAGPNVVSRRRFFGIGAGAAGVVGSGLWAPLRADLDADDRDREGEGRACPEQNPIPHINRAAGPQTFGSFHFFFPGPIDGTPSASDPEPAAAHAAGRDPSLEFNF